MFFLPPVVPPQYSIQKTTPLFSSSLRVAKKCFFFDECLDRSSNRRRIAIVSGDSLLEPGGGVFRLTSNSPTNKFLETLRESIHPIAAFNALINNVSHSSHDLSFNVSPLLLLLEGWPLDHHRGGPPILGGEVREARIELMCIDMLILINLSWKIANSYVHRRGLPPKVQECECSSMTQRNDGLTNRSSDGDKLAESDTATGSGEVPVNQTPTLNETTTAAQSFLGMVWSETLTKNSLLNNLQLLTTSPPTSP
ncbi:hypothetical protein F2Q69_00027166 [Brassica cretica]|uniref:Uncharacterized protein n=1 Tax=Brassica cretica TaxID=69181 RepID=A0A8S9S1J3_BRACR|nr:hypothetical protein F2Q69_00027166 [Brassica cretica]